MLGRRLALVVGVWACVVVMGLALGGASALALDTHVFSGSFAGSGAGALAEPSGVAVNDETGDVYVVDKGHNRVEEFDATGSTLLGEFNGASAGHALSGPEGIAMDNSTNPLDPSRGDVYVVDAGHKVVDKFTAAGAFVGQIAETTGGAAFAGLAGVGVDPSGVVWVYQASGVIDSFSDAATNVFLSELPSRFGGVTSPGFAVDGADNLYINRGIHVFAKLNSSGTVLIPEVVQNIEERSTAAAVNTTSDEVFIDNEQSIGTYDSTGAFLARFGAGNIESSYGIAVNSANDAVYVADAAAGKVEVFAAAVLPDVSTGTSAGVQATGATVSGTVNPDGVPVTSCVFEYGTSTEYGQSAPCSSNPGSGSIPVAVSTELTGLREGSVYHYRVRAANASGANPGEDQTFTTPGRPSVAEQYTEGVTQTGATIVAIVNPNGPATTYHFEYGTSTAYGTSVPVPDGSLGAGNGEQEASATLTGLQPGTVYHFRIVAVNSLGTSTSSDETFRSIPAARIDSASASEVTASSATLDAKIDPLGNDTTYHFEYGTSTAYGSSVPVPDADVGSGNSDVIVSQRLTGLAANTTYHYRVVARNAVGTETGADHTFVYSTGGVGLPDNRAYELVTPPQKNGALIGNTFGSFEPDISEDGSRLVLVTTQCFGDAVSCTVNDVTVGTPYMFTRTGGGWVASALAPSASQFSTSDARLVSADAGTALFTMPTQPFGEYDWYARGVDGSFSDIGPTVPPASGRSSEDGRDTSWEATADLSHIVYTGGPVWPFDATTGYPGTESSVYEYEGVGNTAPVLVGVSGGPGSTDLISVCGTVLGNGGYDLSSYNALSEDGRTVFFTAQKNDGSGGRCPSGSGVNAGVPVPKDELFARIDESRTVPISVRSPLECTAGSGCLGSSPGDAKFVGASADGSKVFFLDTQQLTDSASEDSQQNNLYEYDFTAPAGRNLVAVSAGDSSGGGPRVQGVVEISPDGSHVYFVARGVLTSVANERGQLPQNGGENLYVYERDAANPGGRLAFIATLSEADDEIESHSVWTGSTFLANVTPEGRFLVFESRNALTADDSSTTGAVQVFRYDALTGHLVRISIGNDGFNDNGNTGVGNAGIAAPLDSGRAGPVRTDPTMSSDGSFVFFESPVALTPGALDDVPLGGVELETGEPAYAYNVYEWHEGHVYLLSDGRDVSKGLPSHCEHLSSVCLLGADSSGRNVFFTTGDPLVPEDGDTSLDVYDARVCTQSEPCIAPAASVPATCQGDGCHGAAAGTPPVVDAGSAVFTGPGNLTAPAAPVVKGKAKKHRSKAKKKAVKRTRGHGRSRRRAVRSSSRQGYTSSERGK